MTTLAIPAVESHLVTSVLLVDHIVPNKWYDVELWLPPVGVYVLVYGPLGNWSDSTDSIGVFHKVVRRSNGSSETNNHGNYTWNEFGPGSYWTQNVTRWMYFSRGSP